MIASISGTVKHVGLTTVVVEAGGNSGVGMLLHIPSNLAATLLVGKSAEFFTSLVVREDALTLYGFDSAGARDFFELLQTVSGIGPKVAQSALSLLSQEEIATAISREDHRTLESIPGLGKKGVQRLILELKEKVSRLNFSTPHSPTDTWRDSLLSALIGLGYAAKESESALDKVAQEFGTSVSQQNSSLLLKAALQNLGRSV